MDKTTLRNGEEKEARGGKVEGKAEEDRRQKKVKQRKRNDCEETIITSNDETFLKTSPKLQTHLVRGV